MWSNSNWKRNSYGALSNTFYFFLLRSKDHKETTLNSTICKKLSFDTFCKIWPKFGLMQNTCDGQPSVLGAKVKFLGAKEQKYFLLLFALLGTKCFPYKYCSSSFIWIIPQIVRNSSWAFFVIESLVYFHGVWVGKHFWVKLFFVSNNYEVFSWNIFLGLIRILSLIWYYLLCVGHIVKFVLPFILFT